MMGFLIPNQRQQPNNDQKRQQIANMIMGQQPQTVGGGLGQLIGGIALNIGNRNSAFPQAPGGGTPSFRTGLMNFFTGGRNGGLY